MATPAAESNMHATLPANLENDLNTLWNGLLRSKEEWKREQRLALFQCSCDAEQTPPPEKRRALKEAGQTGQLRKLQELYEKVERQVTQWRKLAAGCGDQVMYGKLNDFLRIMVQSSCICVKQPPPIVDSESKRSRPKVEILVLCGRVSNFIQDAKEEFVFHLISIEEARHIAEGNGLPSSSSSEYKVEWYGKKPVRLSWDSVDRVFRAKFNDVVLKKPLGHKWLGGYHLYFCNVAGSTRSTNSCDEHIAFWSLSTPFEIVSNRTGQLAVKMRDEFWRLAFCTNDTNGCTVGLRPTVETGLFLNVFGRWFQGFTGASTGLTVDHERSVCQMLKGQNGVITWERMKRNWMHLYLAAVYVKQNTFLWNAGILNHCFATREEAEKLLSAYHDPTMLIRFQQTAAGYLSISFIMPAESSDDGGRYFAHCPLEIYLKRNYTLIQCIEFADLLCPRGKRLKAKLRDFKILGTPTSSTSSFDYRAIMDEDERNREQLYAALQSKLLNSSEAAEYGDGDGGGPVLDYSSVKERFKIKVSRFPEERFKANNNTTSINISSSSPCSTIASTNASFSLSPQQYPTSFFVSHQESSGPAESMTCGVEPEDTVRQTSCGDWTDMDKMQTTNWCGSSTPDPGQFSSGGLPYYYATTASTNDVERGGDQCITDDDLSLLLEAFRTSAVPVDERTVPNTNDKTQENAGEFSSVRTSPPVTSEQSEANAEYSEMMMDFETTDFLVPY